MSQMLFFNSYFVRSNSQRLKYQGFTQSDYKHIGLKRLELWQVFGSFTLLITEVSFCHKLQLDGVNL